MILLLASLAFAAPEVTSYVGVNVLALATLPPGAVPRTMMPFFSNFEDGVGLQAGVIVGPTDGVELRVSVGPSHPDTVVSQVQVGYTRYFLHQHLLAGVFLRFVDNASLLTDQQFYSVSPYIMVGGRGRLAGPVYADGRVGWDFASVAWSSVDHSRPGIGFVRMPPSVVLDIGVEF